MTTTFVDGEAYPHPQGKKQSVNFLVEERFYNEILLMCLSQQA